LAKPFRFAPALAPEIAQLDAAIAAGRAALGLPPQQERTGTDARR
jgi:hypothetical protein